MNANFRRDYLYQLATDYKGFKEKQLLRYLKYDRASKSYIFLTGRFSSKKEKMLVVKHTELWESKKAIKITYCNGYEATNGYNGLTGKRLKLIKTLEKGDKLSIDKEVGSIYGLIYGDYEFTGKFSGDSAILLGGEYHSTFYLNQHVLKDLDVRRLG